MRRVLQLRTLIQFLFLITSLSIGRAVLGAGLVEVAWIQRYDGTAEAIDFPTGISSDRYGNIYVGGASDGCRTLSFSQNVCGSDRIGLRYNRLGLPQWITRIEGEGQTDGFSKSVADANGNLYVMGTAALVKFDSNGQFNWKTPLKGGLAMVIDRPRQVVPDIQNPYITGLEGTFKLAGDGRFVWINPTNGGVALALDTFENVYVAGRILNRSTMQSDFTTTKYDIDGREVWTRTYVGPLGGPDSARAVTVDQDRNIIVTGSAVTSRACCGDCLVLCPISSMVTVKYTPDGEELWRALYDGPGENLGVPDTGTVVRADANGNVYVAGNSQGGPRLGSFYGPRDFAVIKYDAGGRQLWVARVPRAEFFEGSGLRDMALDATGNIYVTGGSDGLAYRPRTDFPFPDYLTVKFNGQGHRVWTMRYDGGSNHDDIATGILVNSSNEVYVTGLSVGPKSHDIVTIKYVQAAANATNATNAPSIVSEPKSQSILPGQAALLSVLARGIPPLQYQWHFNSADLPGATNASLMASNVGEYSVTISNVAGVTVTPLVRIQESYPVATIRRNFTNLEVEALSPLPVALEASDDLFVWERVSNLASNVFFLNAAEVRSLPRRFYRARSP